MTIDDYGYTYNCMKYKKGGKPMRVKVTTTLAVDLWEELRVHAIRGKTDANVILEELIANYLKKSKKKGGKK